MPQVYTADFILKNDVLEEEWADDRFPNAKTIRDKRAKELRKEGWTVKSGKYDYTDLGRFTIFWLVATRNKMKEEKSL